MALDIDASDIRRAIYRIRQTIPLAPGTDHLTLLYPKWLPGSHAPRGPIQQLVDLRMSVGGQPVAWRRDPADVNAFHVDLPAGAKSLQADFIHASPLQSSEGRITMTPEMLNLQWEKMSLYPAGHYVRRIMIRPTVTLPPGWTAASALDGQRTVGDRVTWDATDYESLVDSPIFAGRYAHRWNLGHDVWLNAVADSPDLLEIQPDHLATMPALVAEALQTFGRPAFDRYEFLVALTDRLGGIGLEHLESSENQLEPRTFVDWAPMDWDRNVLAHELVHSWNGKYRRPERLWTPDYRAPMDDSLLWVYEGQTQFWGWVLAARSGLQSKDVVLGMMARSAGAYAEQPGRAWRSVADTTYDPIIAARRPKPWDSLVRSEDYYSEGALIWLEADQIIRAGTGGSRGLDNFARAFFAHPGDGSRVSTYGFGDVIAALNAVYPYDWARFLRERVYLAGRPAPLAGIEAGGYRLVWKEIPNSYDRERMAKEGTLTLNHSIGLILDRDGEVSETEWNSAAFNAGIVPGAQILAVDGQVFSHDAMRRAISRAKGDKQPIALIVRRGDRFETISVPYSGGLRWPWLERAAGVTDGGLDRLMAPRRASGPK